MNDPCTTNLADFDRNSQREAVALLQLWLNEGLEGFGEDGVQVMLNRNSGCVFLTNDEYQVAMMNGNKLELWHNCGNCGHEGFAEDCQLNDDGCNECNPQNGVES